MENHEKISKEITETFTELGRHAKVANERLRIFLKDLPKDEMIARINQLNLSDNSLNFLCEGIALEMEDYEICAAVEEIKRVRESKWMKIKEDLLHHTSSDTPPALSILPG